MAEHITSIAVFNNKGGVGKTSLVYHLAWMYANLGYNVLVADLDPQANLTAMFLSDDELESLWEASNATIHAAMQPLLAGTGDATMPELVEPTVGLSLVAGDMRLSNAEDELSSQWPASLDGKERALRVLSAIWRSLRLAADHVRADLVLLDVSPNLGALNRAALVAADYVVVPVAPDLYSLQGLRNLGPTLRRWRSDWAERRKRNPVESLPMPRGAMKPIGYVVLPHTVRFDQPFKAYGRWMARMDGAYSERLSPACAAQGHCIENLVSGGRQTLPFDSQELPQPDAPRSRSAQANVRFEARRWGSRRPHPCCVGLPPRFPRSGSRDRAPLQSA